MNREKKYSLFYVASRDFSNRITKRFNPKLIFKRQSVFFFFVRCFLHFYIAPKTFCLLFITFLFTFIRHYFSKCTSRRGGKPRIHLYKPAQTFPSRYKNSATFRPPSIIVFHSPPLKSFYLLSRVISHSPDVNH